MQPAADILIVDDDPAAITFLKSALNGQGRLRFATSGSEALRIARHTVPDLVLLDIEMPGLSGFEVCRALKDDPQTAEVPVIFLTGHDQAAEELTGLSLGAVDFIGKPARPPLVCARVQTHLRLKRMSDALRRAATEDAVTGVANRRRFDEALDAEWLRHARGGRPLALLRLDLDPALAEQALPLRQIAQALRTAARRPGDLLARLEGPQFALLLPDTDPAGAGAVARQLQTTWDTLPMAPARSAADAWGDLAIGGACAASLGPPLRTVAGHAEDLLAAADQALDTAKRLDPPGCVIASR